MSTQEFSPQFDQNQDAEAIALQQRQTPALLGLASLALGSTLALGGANIAAIEPAAAATVSETASDGLKCNTSHLSKAQKREQDDMTRDVRDDGFANACIRGGIGGSYVVDLAFRGKNCVLKGVSVGLNRNRTDAVKYQQYLPGPGGTTEVVTWKNASDLAHQKGAHACEDMNRTVRRAEHNPPLVTATTTR